MIVTCEECSTSFQLDEKRIPARGARVRCSRCKHAFFLAHPSASQAEVVDSVAADAAADPTAAGPSAAEDLLGGLRDFGEHLAGGLSDSAEDFSGGVHDSSERLAGGLSDSAAGLGDPAPEFDEEEEWQFSEEVRVAGDEPDEDLNDPIAGTDAPFAGEVSPEERDQIFGESGVFGAESDEAVLGEGSPAGLDAEPGSERPAVVSEAFVDDGRGSGLELDVPDPPVAAGDAPSRDESGFGTVDEFSSLMEEDPAEVGVDLVSEDVDVGELDDGVGSSSGVGTYAEQGATDDLGDPESWDLVGGDDVAAERPSLVSVSRSFTDGISDRGEPVSADEFFDGGESEHEDPDTLEGVGLPKVITVPLGIAARTIGWAVTLGLIGAFLFFGGRAELGRWSEAPQQARVGAFEVATEDSGWVETSRAGYVLRFTGRVRNAGDRPLWPGTVQLALLDGAGERVLAEPVLAGTPIDPRVLREAPAERLASETKSAIRRFAGQPLASGEERRFEALVPEAKLPPQAHRVLLEVGEPKARPDGSRGIQAPDEPGLSP